MLSGYTPIAMRASFHPFLNLLILSLNNIEYNLKPENTQQKTGYPGFRKVFHFLFFIWIFLKIHSQDFFPCCPSSHICRSLLFPFPSFEIFVYSCLFKDFCFSYFQTQKAWELCITAIWNIVKMSFYFFTLPLNAYTYNKSFWALLEISI